MLGIKCAKSETSAGSAECAPHDPTGGGSLQGLAQGRPVHPVATFRPGLIILDVVLPGLDGIEACRCRPETQDIRILGVTGHPARVPVPLGAGADACITRPLDLDVVCREVSRLLASATGVPHSLTGREG